MELEQTTFAGACKKYFGLRPGQGLSDLVAEMKALTDQDKDDLKAMFPSVGFKIMEPVKQ